MKFIWPEISYITLKLVNIIGIVLPNGRALKQFCAVVYLIDVLVSSNYLLFVYIIIVLITIFPLVLVFPMLIRS